MAEKGNWSACSYWAYGLVGFISLAKHQNIDGKLQG